MSARAKRRRPRPELSSKILASLAGRVLKNEGKCTPAEACALAASVLTQAPDK